MVSCLTCVWRAGMNVEFPKTINRQSGGLQRILKMTLGLLWLGVVLWFLTTPRSVEAQLPDRSMQIAQAGALKELQKQQQQIEQQRSQVSKERNRLHNIQKAAEGNLSGLKQTIKATVSQINQSETRLQQATQHLRKLETVLKKAEESYHQRQFSTVARLRFCSGSR